MRFAVLARLLCLTVLVALVPAPSALGAGWYQSGFVGKDPQPGQLSNPRGVAVAPDGKVVVADTSHSRVQVFAPDGSHLFSFGSFGAQPGAFSGVENVEVGPDGSIYVLSEFNHEVQQFDAAGTFVRRWGSLGAGPGQLNRPNALAVATDGSLWVSDRANHRIQQFSATGTFIRSVGGWGAANGQMNTPHDVAVADDGSVWVADYTNTRMQKFSATGTHLLSVAIGFPPTSVAAGAGNTVWMTADGCRLRQYDATGTVVNMIDGCGSLQLVTALRMTAGADGSVYVVERTRGRVQRLAAGGARLATFGYALATGTFLRVHGADVAPDGTIYTVDGDLMRVQYFASDGTFIDSWGASGSGDGQMYVPTDIEVAPDGSVYVVDYANNRIQQFSSSGIFLRKWGTTGAGAGQFNGPWGADFGPDGNLYVTDRGNNRIQVFTPTGTFVRAFGSSGSGPGQLSAPADLAIDDAGNLYVAEVSNRRVQKLDPNGASLQVFGNGIGGNPGQLWDTLDVEVMDDGSIWVLTQYGWSLHHFAADGTFVERYASTGSGNGTTLIPTGIARVSDDELVVADTYNFRMTRWKLDAAPPAVSASTAATSSQVTFSLAATDLGAGLDAAAYSFDGGATFQASPTITIDGQLPGVTVTRTVVVRDRLGNVSSPITVAATTRDEVAPVIAPLQNVPSFVVRSAGLLRFAITDANPGPLNVTATYEGNRVPVTDGSISMSALREGRGWLRVSATDAAGNTRSLEQELVIDRTPPRIVTRVYRLMSTKVRLRISDVVSGARPRTLDVRSIPLGRHVVRTTIADRAGNRRRVRVVVVRHLSLSRPHRNAGLDLAPGISSPARVRRALAHIDRAPIGFRPPDGSLAHELLSETQWRLKRFGCLEAGHETTGRLTVETREAIRCFQRTEGLAVSGRLDRSTLRSLDRHVLQLPSRLTRLH